MKNTFLWVAFALCFFSQSSLTYSAEFKVGLVLDRGGKDDKSFNASAYSGANEAAKKFEDNKSEPPGKDEGKKVTVKTVEATDDNSFEPLLRSFAQKDFDLIIGIGFAQMDAMKKIAGQFPKKNFAIVDAEVKLPNVASLMFEEHEGAYLVGALAALTSKTHVVGFIGGMDIPLIRRFEKGYEAGARAADPKVVIKSNYVGVTPEAWNNPPKAKELAISQYNSKADVIFGAAGASGSGLFDAAEEAKKLAIGVDSNQNWIKPGFVLTSMLKRVDHAVFTTISDARAGKFKAGIVRFGLGNQGVDYAMDKFNEKLVSPEVRAKVEALKAQIIAGKIHVPDYYKMKSGK